MAWTWIHRLFWTCIHQLSWTWIHRLVTKRACLVAALLLAGVGLTSGFLSVDVEIPLQRRNASSVGARVEAGNITLWYGWHSPLWNRVPTAHLKVREQWGFRPSHSYQLVPSAISSKEGFYFDIPLWVLLAIAVGLTAYLWRTDRAPSWQCPKCRYDLRGHDGGVCPECGTPIAECET